MDMSHNAATSTNSSRYRDQVPGTGTWFSQSSESRNRARDICVEGRDQSDTEGDVLTDRPRNRVYHGINGNAEGVDTRILVVQGGGGPTERQRNKVTVLYELSPKDPFWWGYTGGSPSRTAGAIIEDVLPDLATVEPALAELSNTQHTDLVVAFLVDVIGHLHDDREDRKSVV